ncbi:MAG: ribosome maturation factor RimM [Kangiellaceae bacterium]|jgi:16S rRNA processing protein RimM
MDSSTPVKKPLIVGQISGVFGVHGWVKIFSHTEPRENILKYNPWLVKQKGNWKSISLLKGRKQGKTIVAHLDKVDDRELAHSMIGCDIAIDESQLKKLDDNDFYWRELQGLTVINTQGVELGKVTSMMATGANDVVVVKMPAEMVADKKEHEILIPYLLDSVIKEVNLEEGLMKVDWDEDFD